MMERLRAMMSRPHSNACGNAQNVRSVSDPCSSCEFCQPCSSDSTTQKQKPHFEGDLEGALFNIAASSCELGQAGPAVPALLFLRVMQHGGEITFKVQEGGKVCGVDALHIEGAQWRASPLRLGAVHCDSIHREKLREDNTSVMPSALQHVSLHISQ